MVGLLRAWGGAFLVLVIGMAVVVAMTPRTVPGQSISLSDQILRIHLPWLVMVVVMVPAAAALDWESWSAAMSRRLQATLPVPVLAILAGAAIGAGGGTSAVTALLYVVEGIAGVALGLLALVLVGHARETPAYP